jgi:WD40 repeat protein
MITLADRNPPFWRKKAIGINRSIIAFMRQGPVVVLVSASSFLCVALAQTPDLEDQRGHGAKVTTIAFHGDSNLIASGDEAGDIRIWDSHTAFIVKTLNAHHEPIKELRFNRLGNLLASADEAIGKSSCHVALWDVLSGKVVQTFDHDFHKDLAIRFNDKDDLLVSIITTKNELKIWNLSQRKQEQLLPIEQLKPFEEQTQSGFTLSPDNSSVAWIKRPDFIRIREFGASEVFSLPADPDHWPAYDPRIHDLQHGVLWLLYGPNGDSVLSVETIAASSQSLERNCLNLWNLRERSEKRCIVDDPQGFSLVVFSTDGSLIAFVNGSKALRIFDLKRNAFKNCDAFKRPSDQEIGSLRFNPDGRSLAVGLGNSIQLVDVENNVVSEPFTGSSETSGRFSFAHLEEDDRLLLSKDESEDGLWLWNFRAANFRMLTQVIPYDEGHLYSVSRDGSELAFLCRSTTICFWDLKKNVLISQFASDQMFLPADQFEFSPDGRTHLSSIRSRYGKEAALVDVESGKLLLTFTANEKTYGFSPDGRLVAFGFQSSVIVWDIQSTKEKYSLKSSAASISNVSFSPDGKFLASGNEDGTVRIWRVENGKLEQTLKEHDAGVDGVLFSSNGKFFLSHDAARNTKIWDTNSWKVLRTFSENFGNILADEQLTFSSDGTTLISWLRNGFTISFWNIETNKEETVPIDNKATGLKLLNMAPAVHRALYGSVFGGNLVAFRENRNLSLVDKNTGRDIAELRQLAGGNYVVVAPDGRFDSSLPPDELKGLAWAFFRKGQVSSFPIGIFMRDYYEPLLLTRLLRGDKFDLIPSLSELNHAQPKVEKITVTPQPNDQSIVNIRVKVSAGTEQLVKDGRPVIRESGVYDLRLYRDGQLVGESPRPQASLAGNPTSGNTGLEQLQHWRAVSVVKTDDDRPVSAGTGSREIVFENIRLPQRSHISQVEFSAYAFNEDRVKSAPIPPTVYTLPKPRKVTARRAYVITVGVDATTDPNWRLAFAPNSARDIEQLLRTKLEPEYEFVSVPLISEYQHKPESATRYAPTKRNIQSVLAILSGQKLSENERERLPNHDQIRTATPDDLVVLYVASHGYASQTGAFYVVPSDIGDAVGVSEELLNRCPADSVDSPSCRSAKSFLQHSISSDELTQWLRPLDAGQIVLVLDSCHSGAVLGPRFRPGPMGDRGFGQLSYDKGMLVLAATQAEKFTFGTLELNDRSLLTYALTHQADAISFSLEQWLASAETLVPDLYKQHLQNENQETQEPLFFNFVKKRHLN